MQPLPFFTRICAVGVVAICTVSSSLGAKDIVRMPGPAPQQRVIDPVATNARCESCHIEIANEWKRSLHHASHTDPVYQRAFALEPMAFCQGCHAPEADPQAPVPNAIGALGIGCVTCHSTGHDVLAVPRPGGPTDHVDAHGIVRDARFATAAACASCHEFAFPDAGKRAKPELMQSTITEHGASTQANQSCADCHMPLVNDKSGAKPHRSHVFEASRNTEMVRRAITISAIRTGPTTARMTLTPTWSGHAFPTGDLFRRLEVHVDAVGTDYQSVASSTRYLMRHFAEKKHGAGVVRYVASDDRPWNAPIVVEMDLGKDATNLPLAYRVAYQRVEHPRSERPEDSVVEGEIVLSAGTLPPPGKNK
jgi:hypothetical protein